MEAPKTEHNSVDNHLISIVSREAKRSLEDGDGNLIFLISDHVFISSSFSFPPNFQIEFSEESVAFLVSELGCALDYLQTQRVLHRLVSVDSDNLLLRIKCISLPFLLQGYQTG